jgi:hypothetical protein
VPFGHGHAPVSLMFFVDILAVVEC